VESESLVVVVLMALLVGFSSLSRRLGRWNLTAPIVFVAAGLLLNVTLGADAEELGWLRSLAEFTLALVLFTDAASVRPTQISRDGGFVSRLLLVGLPLTVLAGYLLAGALFPDGGGAAALLLAAMLAPTDAALGAATVSDRRIPVRVRRILNVESGLNDGLATPVVLFAIAMLAAGGAGGDAGPVHAVREIALGVMAGAALGYAGGALLRTSERRDWSSPRSRAVGTLALAFLAYFGALAVEGNGFIATFVAGSFFGIALSKGMSAHVLDLAEGLSQPLGDATWLAFGALLVPLLIRDLGPAEVVFALASLTVLRMVPVAVSLLGSGLRWQTQVFIGWFGPRGLASVVFSLIALETLGESEVLDPVLATAALTILLSVVLHGLSAGPGAARYAQWTREARPPVEMAESQEPLGRGMKVLTGNGEDTSQPS
jgi:NhaP-type Na+/H+ or K+/H+ antiporter